MSKDIASVVTTSEKTTITYTDGTEETRSPGQTVAADVLTDAVVTVKMDKR